MNQRGWHEDHERNFRHDHPGWRELLALELGDMLQLAELLDVAGVLEGNRR